MKDTREGMCFPGAGSMPPMGQMMGPGMMSPGMGPGMMSPGMGPGMMSPGMGPGMMSPGMGPGMMSPGMMNQGMTPGMAGTGMMPNAGQLETRIASLERQVRRLDARVGRIETPYPSTTAQPYTGTPGGFTDTQEQPYSYPYQTSMQVM